MEENIRVALEEIRERYKKGGQIYQEQELKTYSVNDVKGLVCGHTLMRKCCGKICAVKCCGDEFPIDDLVKPKCPNPHQWRIKKSIREKVAKQLVEKKIFKKHYNNFEELYDEIKQIASGQLFRYDIAKRIGHCIGIAPKDYVYLQCGAKDGAKVLRDKKAILLPSRISFRVKKSVFDDAFPNMESIDIENLLCIHKKEFEKL
ncbi:MAG: hypothetical protein J1E58_00885 [Prevotella sp.]|nr:hypothetical protein [Prevotella sp.]